MIVVDYVFVCDAEGCSESTVIGHDLTQPQRPPEICLPEGWHSREDGLRCPRHSEAA